MMPKRVAAILGCICMPQTCICWYHEEKKNNLFVRNLVCDQHENVFRERGKFEINLKIVKAMQFWIMACSLRDG